MNHETEVSLHIQRIASMFKYIRYIFNVHSLIVLIIHID